MLARQRLAAGEVQGQARFEWLHKRVDTGETFPAELEPPSGRREIVAAGYNFKRNNG